MKRTRVRARSAKRTAMHYDLFVQGRLAISARCEVGPRIRTVDPLWLGCRRRATGLHHLRKRSSSARIVTRLGTLRSCNPCNGWVENEGNRPIGPDHETLAHLAGLVVRPGDPWWPWLGRRRPSGGYW